MISAIRKGLTNLAGATLAAVALTVGAQAAYPPRPIKLVVPYPPGALTDLLARAIGERLAAALKQPELVAKSPADGYTLLMATSTTLGISPALYRPSPIDPVKDFAPVAQLGSVNFFLIASVNFPARNVGQMIDAIRRALGKYNYASAGSGSPHYLYMEALKTEFGLDIQHVLYRGTSAARQTTLLPAVPPVAATVAGFDWQAWQGIAAPAGTPKEIVARLATELQRIQTTPEFREQLFKFGMEPSAPHAPAEFAAIIEAEQPRWAKAVRESGAKVD